MTRSLPDYTAELHQQQRASAYVAYVRASLTKSWADLPDTAAMRHVKAAVSISDAAALRNAATEYVELVVHKTILGQMAADTVQVPPYVPVVNVTDDPLGTWVGDGRPIPMGTLPTTTTMTESTKLATIIAFDPRSLAADPRSRRLFERNLTNKLRVMEDQKVLGTDAAIPNIQPAGLLNGLTPVTGATLSDKLAALLAAIGGNPRSPYLITSPATAATWTAATRPSMPIVESAAAAGKLVLVDAAKLIVADDGLETNVSTDAVLEMSDTPINASIPPTGGQVISMYQVNAVALRAIRFLWWQVASGAVAFAAA